MARPEARKPHDTIQHTKDKIKHLSEENIQIINRKLNDLLVQTIQKIENRPRITGMQWLSPGDLYWLHGNVSRKTIRGEEKIEKRTLNALINRSLAVRRMDKNKPGVSLAGGLLLAVYQDHDVKHALGKGRFNHHLDVLIAVTLSQISPINSSISEKPQNPKEQYIRQVYNQLDINEGDS